MLTLVIGGAASGKSAYAESLTLKLPLPRYYVATMQVWDEECAKRVEKHRAMRKEKQFETIESPISLDKIRIPNRGIVLLEDLGNLTANELYDPKGAGVNTAEAVLYGVEMLYKQCEHLIVVGNEVFSGLNEKICIQVQRVYDSCLMQEQLKEQKVTLLSYGLVPCCNGPCGEQQENANTQPTMPITFESCRSTSTEGVIRNLSVERLCDRPCFGRVRCQIDVPIDILFTDAACREYIGRGMVTVDRDVLLSIPDESIVPYNIESMVSAICVSGTYLRNNVFELEICVTVVLKVLAKVEVLVPSYGYCEVPPCEEFADSVCDEFFSLPLFPQAVCDEDALRARNVSCTCGNYASSTGLGCATTAAGMGCAGTCGCKC